MIDARSVVDEVERLRTGCAGVVTLESLRQVLQNRYRHGGYRLWYGRQAADHAIIEALLAGKIELRPARFVIGENTNTYIVFVRK